MVRPFYFRGKNDRMSLCGLTLLRKGPEALTVVITELPANPGTSVSEAFEKLATLLFQTRIVFLKVAPERVVWIEHTVEGEGAAGEHVQESYTQVVLEWDGRTYHSPKRVPLPPETWSEFSTAAG